MPVAIWNEGNGQKERALSGENLRNGGAEGQILERVRKDRQRPLRRRRRGLFFCPFFLLIDVGVVIVVVAAVIRSGEWRRKTRL